MFLQGHKICLKKQLSKIIFTNAMLGGHRAVPTTLVYF